MTDEYLQRAKEIFFKYACSHFYLDRDVDVNEYKKYDVSREQETVWYREYTSYWISQLSADNFQAVNNLSSACAGEALPDMFRISELGDSFTRLWYANAIWKMACNTVMSPIMRERARRRSISLWKSLLKNPVELTDDHRKRISKIVEDNLKTDEAFQAARESRGLPQYRAISRVTTPDEYILHYAKSKLEESKQRNIFYFLFISFFLNK